MFLIRSAPRLALLAGLSGLLLSANASAAAAPAKATAAKVPAAKAPAAKAAAPTPPAAPDKATQLKAAFKASDKAYASRNSAADAAALKQASALDAANFGVLWRLSRHHFTKADKSKSDSVKKREGKIAWDYADKAIKAKPSHPAGYYWATAGIGEFSTGAGLITAIRMGIAGKFKRNAKAVIARSKRFEHGGGYRALGRFYFSLPWPKRDLDKSIALLRNAVKFGPMKARNYAWLAESLIKEGEEKEARAVLLACAKAKPRREDYRDGIKFKRICVRLLKNL